MPYSFNEIKTFHENANGFSITTMATKMLEMLPELTKGLPYQKTRIEGSPEEIAFKELGIDQKVLNVAISNLAAFLLTKDISKVTRIPGNWAKEVGDKETTTFFQCLAKWIKGDDHRSIVNLVYFAHYEAEIRKRRKMDSGNIVLPSLQDAKVIVQLADALIKGMENPKIIAHRVDEFAGFNDTVNKGDIDFLVGDTLYISRLGRTYSRDSYYLLICYVLMRESLKYKNAIINRICLISPSDGERLIIDIRQVDSAVINTVKGCLYGPEETEIIETTLQRKRRAALVMALVELFDIKGTPAVTPWLRKCCAGYGGVSMESTSAFAEANKHFMQSVESDKEDAYYVEGINLLNHLLVTIEDTGKAETRRVKLSEELVHDILNKALDF